MKYYLAYGSNLDVAQMLDRCPGALYIGTTTIPGRLVFRGSKTGSFLSVDEDPDSRVPCVVWALKPGNERSLDLYEGFPSFYKKKTLRVTVQPFAPTYCFEVSAGIYVLPESSPLGCPSRHYYDVCHGGYAQFGFKSSTLYNALVDSIGASEAEAFFRKERDPYGFRFSSDYVPASYRIK